MRKNLENKIFYLAKQNSLITKYNLNCLEDLKSLYFGQMFFFFYLIKTNQKLEKPIFWLYGKQYKCQKQTQEFLQFLKTHHFFHDHKTLDYIHLYLTSGQKDNQKLTKINKI